MITAICGSPRKEKSMTLKYIRMLAEAAGEPVDIFSAADWKVIPCTGCKSCFMEGDCVQKNDDVEIIKHSLIGSDAIIFASPVYAGSLTGQMKILIDRLSVMLHVMPLVGIPSVVLTVSSGNHLVETADFLQETLEYMGSGVVGRVLMGDDGRSDNEEKLCAVGQRLKQVMEGKTPYPLSQKTKQWFQYQNKQYRRFEDLTEDFSGIFGETIIWKKQNYFSCESYEEAVSMRRRVING